MREMPSGKKVIPGSDVRKGEIVTIPAFSSVKIGQSGQEDYARELSVTEGRVLEHAATVRCEIKDSAGRILLLQKAEDSKSPGVWELPGGKVDEGSYKKSAVREVREETGINIDDTSLRSGEQFSYAFEVDGKRYERDVRIVHVSLQTERPEVVINRTRREDGTLEDKHADFRWVTQGEYRQMYEDGELAANSIIPDSV